MVDGRRRAALAAVLVAAGLAAGPAWAADRDGSLRFGVYPGGAAGAVHAPQLQVAPDLRRERAAVDRLAGDADVVVRLYTSLDGRRDDDQDDLVGQVRRWSEAGHDVEVVARHLPARTDAEAAVDAYVDDLSRLARRLSGVRRLHSIQVTNEANVRGAPAAADGSSPGVLEALARGVVAVEHQLARADRRDVSVGFNVAEDRGLSAFFAAVRRVGGRRLDQAVDWIGLDVYPATWSAPERPDRAAVRAAVTEALRTMRRTHMPAGGFGSDVALRVTENGFPTGPGRSEADQVAVLEASVGAVVAARRSLRVTDFRWFALRDAASASQHPEHQYGLLRDDWREKPAFDALRRLIARHGGD
ncbi:hypothetical protein [Conexibacter sp. SYSU D00693]|uniref:hypothetical protein n=1 Tax=Conexibacter sp. SYSU D00693 TaxID=2812560 RepID=UPI00196BA3F2|nr:hypothetical protein [Conexibacter sp. SYSU D00693]